MTLLDLAGPAEALLDLLVTTAAVEGVTLPDRRYITAGASGREAWDCEQVVVGLVQVDAGVSSLPGEVASRTRTAMVAPPGVTYRVEIVRAVRALDDQGGAPEVSDETEAGVAGLRDAALLHAVRAQVLAGAALTGGEPGDARAGAIVPNGPEGTFAGTALTVTVTVMRAV